LFLVNTFIKSTVFVFFLHFKQYIYLFSSATNSAILKMTNIYIKNKADKIILPNEPLSNFQLIDAVKKLKIKNFRGVFIRTDLPKKPRKKECGIMNLDGDLTDETKGTHWVAWAVKNNKNQSEKIYFDSFGIQPPLELINYLREKPGDIEYCTDQIQELNTVICGHLCLQFLIEVQS
jgi:hypothetical protein